MHVLAYTRMLCMHAGALMIATSQICAASLLYHVGVGEEGGCAPCPDGIAIYMSTEHMCTGGQLACTALQQLCALCMMC